MKSSITPWIAAGMAALFLSGCADSATLEPYPTQEPATETSQSALPASDLPEAVGKLHWFGISSVLYTGEKNVYFDPVMVEGQVPPADIILVSHGHADHIEVESLKKIISSETVLIISPNVESFYEMHKDEIGIDAVVLAEGETKEIDGVKIEAVPAFDMRYHAKGTGGVGFVVHVGGDTIYFAGGTNYYPEMAEIVSDVTLYPWYSNKDVLQAADNLSTKVLIPVHASESGVTAFVDVYAKEITKVKIIGLQPGPYNQ